LLIVAGGPVCRKKYAISKVAPVRVAEKALLLLNKESGVSGIPWAFTGAEMSMAAGSRDDGCSGLVVHECRLDISGGGSGRGARWFGLLRRTVGPRRKVADMDILGALEVVLGRAEFIVTAMAPCGLNSLGAQIRVPFYQSLVGEGVPEGTLGRGLSRSHAVWLNTPDGCRRLCDVAGGVTISTCDRDKSMRCCCTSSDLRAVKCEIKRKQDGDEFRNHHQDDRVVKYTARK
jgi:hypothetical protein